MEPEIERLRESLRAIVPLFDVDGSHDLDHLDRVWTNCSRLSRSFAEGQVDRTVLVAATYLHNCVCLPKDHPNRKRSSAMAAEESVVHLEKLDFPADRMGSLKHCILAHSKSAGISANTLEAKVSSDADKLDSLGAIGIARLFYTSGCLGQRMLHPTDPMALDRVANGQLYALDYYVETLAKLNDAFHLDVAKAEGERRASEMAQIVSLLVEPWP